MRAYNWYKGCYFFYENGIAEHPICLWGEKDNLPQITLFDAGIPVKFEVNPWGKLKQLTHFERDINFYKLVPFSKKDMKKLKPLISFKTDSAHITYDPDNPNLGWAYYAYTRYGKKEIIRAPFNMFYDVNQKGCVTLDLSLLWSKNLRKFLNLGWIRKCNQDEIPEFITEK